MIRTNETNHQISCSEVIPRPYKLVRNALVKDAVAIFESATKDSAEDTQGTTELHATIGGLEVGKEIAITVTSIDQHARAPEKSSTATRFGLQWQAIEHRNLFPLMKGELFIYPITGLETAFEFEGDYVPPGGQLGRAIDAIFGHRLAQISVARFIGEVTDYLRSAPLEHIAGPRHSFWD